jgi:hypothetical protein
MTTDRVIQHTVIPHRCTSTYTSCVSCLLCFQHFKTRLVSRCLRCNVHLIRHMALRLAPELFCRACSEIACTACSMPCDDHNRPGGQTWFAGYWLHNRVSQDLHQTLGNQPAEHHTCAPHYAQTALTYAAKVRITPPTITVLVASWHAEGTTCACHAAVRVSYNPCKDKQQPTLDCFCSCGSQQAGTRATLI